MQARSALLLFAVAAVIAVSGCTAISGPSGAAGGSGLVIENFEADFPQAFAGEELQFQARVRNTGSVRADAAQGFVLGLDGWGGDCTEWPEDELGTLLAPDPVRGTAGQSDTKIWTGCQAPDVRPGLSLTSNPTLRVFYHTSSEVLKSVTFASQDELRRAQNLNQPLPAETLSATSSPIAMSIEVKGPIRVFAEDGSVGFPVEIKLSNVGGGVACFPEGGGIGECREGEGWNQVNLHPLSGGAGGSVEVTECASGPVVLWRGQSNSVVCTVRVSDVSTQSGAVQKVLSASADYIYFIDKTASITVTGK